MIHLLVRYRNFRTFASPRPVQFSCLTLDPSGEVVCAGSHDTFEIFVWSMQTGRLLEVGEPTTALCEATRLFLPLDLKKNSIILVPRLSLSHTN